MPAARMSGMMVNFFSLSGVSPRQQERSAQLLQHLEERAWSANS